MGFFDALFGFFGRKPAPPEAPAGPADVKALLAAAGLDAENLPEAYFVEPRCDHYSFAHYALRFAALQDPLQCLGVLASPKANEFLAFLLQQVAENCGARQPTPSFGAGDLKVHRVRLGAFPTAIVEMPPPVAVAETHFNAIVAIGDFSGEIPPPGSVAARYFTLEHGLTLQAGETRTVLCEWTLEGEHRNFGDGPPPRLDAFLAAIERLLSDAPDAPEVEAEFRPPR